MAGPLSQVMFFGMTWCLLIHQMHVWRLSKRQVRPTLACPPPVVLCNSIACASIQPLPAAPCLYDEGSPLALDIVWMVALQGALSEPLLGSTTPAHTNMYGSLVVIGTHRRPSHVKYITAFVVLEAFRSLFVCTLMCLGHGLQQCQRWRTLWPPRS
jgi:hypothetical protein